MKMTMDEMKNIRRFLNRNIDRKEIGELLKQSYLDFPDGKWNCIKAEIEKYNETECIYKLWYYPGEGDIFLEFIVRYTWDEENLIISGIKKSIDDEWYTPTETSVSINDAILEFHKWYLSHLDSPVYAPEHFEACASLYESLKDK